MERFFDGMDQENSKNKEGKKKKSSFFLSFQTFFFLRMWRFPYWCVLSGTPSGYCPSATLPHENPLIWEPTT